MKTAWTAAVLALAFIVGTVTADELRPLLPDHDDKSSVTDGSLHVYRLLNRVDTSRPDSRACKGRQYAAPPLGAIAPRRPQTFYMVATDLAIAQHGACPAHAASARAPPLTT